MIWYDIVEEKIIKDYNVEVEDELVIDANQNGGVKWDVMLEDLEKYVKKRGYSLRS